MLRRKKEGEDRRGGGWVQNSLGAQDSVFISRPTYRVGAAVANLLVLVSNSAVIFSVENKHIEKNM